MGARTDVDDLYRRIDRLETRQADDYQKIIKLVYQKHGEVRSMLQDLLEDVRSGNKENVKEDIILNMMDVMSDITDWSNPERRPLKREFEAANH